MVVADKVSKYFGEQKALDDVSFKASKGRILGLLGPNGAGKSTLMKIITGYIAADEGEVNVCGYKMEVNKPELQHLIGYLPEHNPLHLEMYVKEYLAYVAGLYRVDKANIEELLILVGLTAEKHKKIKALSKGYRQRVGLASALIPNPEVLILDEPTTGLDPNQIVEVRELIKSLAKDKTVILSTHLMQEVKSVCNDVLIINKGKVVANDSVDNVLNLSEKGQQLEVEFLQEVDADLLAKEVKSIGAIESIDAKKLKISVTSKEDVRPDIAQFSASQNWTILMMKQLDSDLEEVFAQLTK